MRKSKVYDDMAQLDSHDIFYTAVERLLDIPLTSRDRISATHRNPYSKEIKIKPNANAKRIRQFVIRNKASRESREKLLLKRIGHRIDAFQVLRNLAFPSTKAI